MMFRLMIALSLTLVSDKAFNHGRLTVELAEQGGGFRTWASRSGGEVADSFIGFRS
jgi:hypothetical protein